MAEIDVDEYIDEASDVILCEEFLRRYSRREKFREVFAKLLKMKVTAKINSLPDGLYTLDENLKLIVRT